MNYRRLATTCGVWALIAFSQLLATAQTQEGAVAERLVTVSFKNQSLYTVLGHVVQKYDVSVGLENSQSDGSGWNNFFEVNQIRNYEDIFESERFKFKPSRNVGEIDRLITVNFRQARLAVVLDEIVRQMCDYEWFLKDEVVNIVPTRGRDPRLVELREMPVDAFGITAGSDISDIPAFIRLAMPEFRTFIERHNLSLESSLLTEPNRNVTETEIVLRSTSFETVLNRSARSKKGGWILAIQKSPVAGGKDLLKVIL